MRFIKTGPNIPNKLIEAQKKGELLFFCGAGVSVPAGLPTFESLTEQVAEKLHALDDKNNEISKLISNYQFDRAFTALKRIYGDEIVDSILLNTLKLTKTPLLKNHENLLKLSTNEENKPFIITTNFDLLFEKVDKKIKSFVPPYLPDLQSKNSLSGIVYLHGKWIDPKKNEPNNLIISSQDFGSAYLSHGWATRFLSNLLTRRTVVLIGYSGDDTLVRYLLEGLNSENSESKNQIYAFERGEQSQIDRKWTQLGAVGISYPDHDDLWDTITEWAKYSHDEDHWNKHVFELSQKSPRDLEAFERGQVTNYISTTKGANKFQLYDPPPHAEWIYVFDKYVRLGEPKTLKDEGGNEYQLDPIDLYGIDTDPYRSEMELIPNHLRNGIGEDFIDNLTIDHSINLRERISNLPYRKLFNVNSRITSLIRWFVKVIEQPAGIWWVANQNNLHPLIISEIEKKISNNSILIPEFKISFFKNLILSHKLLERQPIMDWYQLKFLIEKNNNLFTKSNLYDLESLLEPTIIVNHIFSYNSYLITEEVDNLEIVFKANFIGFNHDVIDVHDNSLVSVIDIITRSLVKFLDLIKTNSTSISSFYHFDYPTITLKDLNYDINETHDNTGKIIVWLIYLIHRQLKIDENEIHKISEKWPKDDNFIFNRFRLSIWTNSKNIKKYNIGENIENFSNELFWNSFLENDLFKLISEQWNNIQDKDRLIIENKIIRYYPNNNSIEQDTYEKSKIYHIGRLLSKIESTNMGLSESSQKYLLKIKSSEKWKENFLKDDPYSPNVISGFVKTNTSTEMLDLNTISESTHLFDKMEKIENNRAIIFEQHRPFIGLIHQDIPYVLNQLLNELELNNLRENFWQQLFYNIPESSNIEENLMIAKAILLLPSKIIFSCRFCLPRWVNEKLVNTCISNQPLFWKVWDYVFNTLNTMGIDATKSSFGDMMRGGKVIKKSRKTLEYALNSPIGQLVNSIFSTFHAWELDPKICKGDYLMRFELALNSVGEGADHATVMIAYRFNFLYSNYRKWTESNLIPLLDIENPLSEPLWNGIMLDSPYKESSLKIKPYLISLVKSKPEWFTNEKFKNNLATYIVVLSLWSYSQPKYYSDIELRNLFRNFDNDMLSHSIWVLNQIITQRKNWSSFGRHFIKNIWPKELTFQSSRISERWLNLILETSNNFLDISKHVMPYLSKIDTGSLFLYRLVKDDKIFLLEQYPDEILLLLDKVIGSRIENYDTYLKKILDKLTQAKPNIKNYPSWRRLKEISD